MPEPLPANTATIKLAAQLLARGELVAFPTETVYGLGADARNPAAVARIFAAKGRPRFNPLIIHVADLETAKTLGEFNEAAGILARQLWPGALTLIVRRRQDCPVCDLATAGLDTIALRVPAHPLAQDLLRTAQLPIAAPSANLSGHVSATSAAHVADDLGEKIAMILDGGPSPIGLESTIIDATCATRGELHILRPGGLSMEELQKAVGRYIRIFTPDELKELRQPGEADEPVRPVSPGQLASHYAPKAALRLNATELEQDEALLAFGVDVPEHNGAMINLSGTGDLVEAAARLYAGLRELDAALDGCSAGKIAVMPIPETGPGAAINDRLRRAAAPRP